MTLIQKIKALFAINSAFEEIKQEAVKMNGPTSGWKSSEFWLTVAAQMATLWGAVQGFVPPKYAAIISVAGAALYTVARTIVKAVSDIKAVNPPTAPVVPPAPAV